MNCDDEIMISATVFTDDEALAARCVEAFTRTGTGLALEGVFLSVTVSRDEHEVNSDA